MVEESKGQHVVVYSNRKKPDDSVPLFLNDGNKLEVEEESCCSAHSTLVSDQNTTFTAVKLHSKVMTLKGTKLDTWPSSTEVACWYDTFPFTTVPIPLVHHYDQAKKAFVIYGNVCSVECGLAYMHRESRRHDLWERVVLFEDMMHKVFKKKIVGCEPAPPFLTLTRFGGFYSIEEYRASFSVVKMTVIAPPFLMYPLVIQEKHHSVEKSSSTKDAVQDETVLSTGHVLRGLRRPQRAATVAIPAPVPVPGPEAQLSVTPAAAFQHVSGPRTVPALDSDSSSDPDTTHVPVGPINVSAAAVPPLSNVQMDTELYTRLARSNKGKGRGRGRGSVTHNRPASFAAASASAPASAPTSTNSTNTMLSNFLIKK